VKWGTPTDIVECARRVLGGIDFDPCSSSFFNETVRAEKYYSLDERGEDGTVLPWEGRTICNPPGGLVRAFWQKAARHKEPLIWIGFSLEQLALLADEEFHPMDWITCIPRKRVNFYRHDGYSGSATHSNYITGINVKRHIFKDAFSGLGRIFLGTYDPL
jgi:hypothetical protein